jgi:hypothetical protein
MSTRYKLALGVDGVSTPDYYVASPIWKYATNGQLSRVGVLIATALSVGD